ncbi:MOSC domain-containing protein [Myxosarcina sp. GI1]|uniref:MOSC domain-containing protein n=1 Tax=Myxosarcina sp. GI1 TaxID=1541065 RepID=UPI000567552B|nr:MOSC N-terminal beta barrel domain-containing protein [Myxosarcina sp. GI1]
MAYLAGIYIYPIKSLDGVAVKSTRLLASGAIEHDREWALFDEENKFVNGKNNAKVHLVRSSFANDFNQLTLNIHNGDSQKVFNLDRDREDIENWLGDYFGFLVRLKRNIQTGFPDDLNANGPTVISTATIETVASWFDNISVAEMRSRLRANLEIDGVPAFWEDRLFASEHDTVSFKIGDVLFEGVNPCQRCVVPTRDTLTGKGDPQFTKKFVAKRRETLPDWANRDRFNHFYRLSVNTNVPRSQADKVIILGDKVEIVSSSFN